MCGIAGLISSRNNSAELLRNMIELLAHRGPDGVNSWSNIQNEAHLAHRRLAVIDLTLKGGQPMHYLDRYAIVHNGEIYNFLELKLQLEAAGYQFKSLSDTEVIMAAYDHWGESCLDHFNGMFAFAVWDEKEKVLFAARDRFGQKPFYFLSKNLDEQFAFASEMKALFPLLKQKNINKNQLLLFLSLGLTNDPADARSTFYEEIQQLPPAHFLTFDLSKRELTIKKYWHLNRNTQHISDKEAIEQFSFLFKSSVESVYTSDLPVGTCLSGGLDSSSIVAVANELQLNNNSYKVFSAVFPGFEKDESFFSKEVANRFGLKQETVSPNGADLARDIQKFLWHQEQPVASASAYAQYKVFECAKQQGIRVLLDGQGADETLGGYLKYLPWIKNDVKGRLARMFPSLTARMLKKKATGKIKNNSDLHPQLAASLQHESLAKPSVHTLNDLLYFNTCVSGLNELLHYADRNSMAHGTEARLPFLDHKLVEFLFSLPSNQKIRNGVTKWILRRSMENTLPANIVHRRDKVGFEPPQKTWMENQDIREMTFVAKENLVKEKYLRTSVLSKTHQPHAAHVADGVDWRYLVAGLMIS